MPDDAKQPADTPKRPRTARSPRRTSRKQTGQAAPSPTPEQEAATSLVAQTASGSTSTQSRPAAGVSSQPAPDETPIGERWGEFPPVERQAELKQRMETWEQEQDHGDRSGPFAGIKLTGADVYWLAALSAGKGDVAEVRQDLVYHADLSKLHIEGADLGDAQLEGATLFRAQLKGANLYRVRLKGAYLREAQLEGANLYRAQLEGANLTGTQLKGANLREARLEGANLSKAQLEGANLPGAQLEGANLPEAQLEGAFLRDAQLEGAFLYGAHLKGANLSEAHLKGANLSEAQLKAVDLSGAKLNGADLREAVFDVDTKLAGARFDPALRVADAIWNGVSLIRVAWGEVPHLGDEAAARQETWMKQPKAPAEWLADYQAAGRAYRQLAIALRSQGITEAADRFTYRALIMQRKALWWQMRSIPLLAGSAKKAAEAGQAPQRPPSAPLRQGAQQIRAWLTEMLGLGRMIGPYLFSLFLAVLTGYGFRMSRIVVAYLLLIGGFAAAYWSVGVHHPRDISFWTALIVSVTAFHGRVFTNPFAPNIPDAQVVITAIEAIVGLVIEGVFIAMLTQRFFNR